MRICLINNLYAPFARGGAETAIDAYAKALEAAGHEIFIITTLPRGEPTPAGNDKIYYLGGWSSIYYHLASLPIFLRFIWQLANLFNFASYFQIKKILAREKPDLVMTHNLMGIGFLTPLAIKQLKIRHFHFLHDVQLLHPSGLIIYGKEKIIDNLPSKIYQAISRRQFSSPEKIISPSAWLLSEHLDRGYFKVSEKLILPNPQLDLKSVAKNSTCLIARLPKRQGGQGFQFLYVGLLENHKGVLFFAETFTKLNSDSAELIIVGDGSQFGALKQISAARENIKLLGRKSREEVFDCMSQADCLVVPSLCYENAPSVIFEAFACGLPVIASAIGGIPELLNNRTELMFTPGSGRELTVRLDWVINNYPQSLKIISDLRGKLPEYSTAEYLKAVL